MDKSAEAARASFRDLLKLLAWVPQLPRFHQPRPGRGLGKPYVWTGQPACVAHVRSQGQARTIAQEFSDFKCLEYMIFQSIFGRVRTAGPGCRAGGDGNGRATPGPAEREGATDE